MSRSKVQPKRESLGRKRTRSSICPAERNRQILKRAKRLVSRMKTIFCINRKSVRAAQPPNKLVDRATEPELGLKDPKEKNFVEPEAEEEKTVVTPMPFTTNEANTVAILSSSTERPHGKSVRFADHILSRTANSTTSDQFKYQSEQSRLLCSIPDARITDILCSLSPATLNHLIDVIEKIEIVERRGGKLLPNLKN
ncbi:unnamed protein product [Enterobius vermicularis]|uniref:DNA-directed RNA polymerase III subunit RPC9 n=1 Tax=Enterobius vermicularis TaxID=51028 RepID=A0A0N4V2F2_ENTVE|nr:unnamed protein product [Enterobius vermicularis]